MQSSRRKRSAPHTKFLSQTASSLSLICTNTPSTKPTRFMGIDGRALLKVISIGGFKKPIFEKFRSAWLRKKSSRRILKRFWPKVKNEKLLTDRWNRNWRNNLNATADRNKHARSARLLIGN